MEKVCEVCGNEQPADLLRCCYCGARQHGDNALNAALMPLRSLRPGNVHRVLNIEQGRPTMAEALHRFSQEMERARSEGVAVITVIHGYGASGRGGVIRTECRKMLEFYKEENVIRNFIAGENFSGKSGPVRALLRRLPELAHNKNLNKNNKGITIVEL